MKFLQFLRLVDENEQLSITNIAVMVVLVKISQTQTTSFEDISLLFLPLMGYAYKKHLKDK